MPDVFLSYSRADQDIARRFAEALEREGFSVWWDQSLNAGEIYDKVTERALEEAKAVVVLWSKASVESRWVRSEATTADRLGTLVPVMIEPCKRPIQFELMQTADLSQWKDSPREPAWQGLVASVRRYVQREASPAPDAGPSPAAAAPASASASAWATSRETGARRGRMRVIAALAALLVGAGVLWTALYRHGATNPPAGQAVDISLAVLPFANLSADRDQEYFSDGLTEEVLNQLAQVPGLRLIGRTSSFAFKGENEDLRVIGRKLGVDNLLEGSVRRDGPQLRITAQLIDARDGSHRWSKTYARELSDVFEVQEEIAREVAQALSIRLDVGEMSRAQGGTTNLDAWTKFQQGRQLLRQDRHDAALVLMREAVSLDPEFAIAWTGLWEALRNTTSLRSPADVAAQLAEMDEAARRVAALAPDSWGAQWISAMQLRQQHRWVEADAAAAKLLQVPLTAENVEKAWGAVFFYSTVGRYEDSIQLMRRMQRIEPLAIGISGDVMLSQSTSARYDAEAAAEYERSKTLDGNHAQADGLALLRLLADERTPPAALRAQFLTTWGEESRWTPFQRELEAKSRDRAAARELIRQWWGSVPTPGRGFARAVVRYADAFGDRELVLSILESDALKGDAQIIWWVPRSGARADPRFKDILRGLGLVDYFRSSGNWGDYCRPVGEDDFECR